MNLPLHSYIHCPAYIPISPASVVRLPNLLLIKSTTYLFPPHDTYLLMAVHPTFGLQKLESRRRVYSNSRLLKKTHSLVSDECLPQEPGIAVGPSSHLTCMSARHSAFAQKQLFADGQSVRRMLVGS